MQYQRRKNFFSAILLAFSFGMTTHTIAADYDNVREQYSIKGANDEKLGEAIALSKDGKLMVIGMPSHKNGGRSNVGAIRLYKKDAKNKWEAITDIFPNLIVNSSGSTESGTDFGFSVAIDPVIKNGVYTIVAGAYNKDSGRSPNSDEGAIYVLQGELDSTVAEWKSSKAELFAPNKQAGDYFGYSVDIYDGTIIVGAPDERGNENSNEANPVYDVNDSSVVASMADNSHKKSGAAYLFKKVGGIWTPTAYLKAPDNKKITYQNQYGWNVTRTYKGQFGKTVSINAKQIVIGAPATLHYDASHNKIDTLYTGAVYVFNKDDSATLGWQYARKLTMEKNGDTDGGNFGDSLATSDKHTVVGLTGRYATNGTYAFVYDNNDYSTYQRITGDESINSDYFAKSIAIDEHSDSILIGAPEEDGGDRDIDGDQTDNTADNIGAAYLFELKNGTWQQRNYIKGSDTLEDYKFGTAVAIANSDIIVSAPEAFVRESYRKINFGQVYIFNRPLKYELSGTIENLSNGIIKITNTNNANNTVIETISFVTSPENASNLAPSAYQVVNNGAIKLSPVVKGNYTLAISEQPKGQTCKFNNNSQSVTVTDSDIDTISITCSNKSYTVGGTIDGLNGRLILKNTVNGEELSINKPTSSDPISFTFKQQVEHSKPYEIIIKQSTNGEQFCSIRHSDGTIDGTNVNNVEINCKSVYVKPYNIKGTVDTPSAVTLKLSIQGTEKTFDLSTNNNEYDLGEKYPNGDYTINIVEANNHLTCSFDGGLSFKTVTVSNGRATVDKITCAAPTTRYPVNVKINNLKNNIILKFNGETAVVEANNTSEVVTKLADLTKDADYNLSIFQQPQGQNCKIPQGTEAGNVSASAQGVTIPVKCEEVVIQTYPITGNVVTDYDVGLTFNINGQEKSVTATKNNPAIELRGFEAGDYSIYLVSTSDKVTCAFADGGKFTTLTVIDQPAKLPTVTCKAEADNYPITIKWLNLKADVQLSADNYIVNVSASTSEKTLGQKQTGEAYRVEINIQPKGQVCYLSGNHKGVMKEKPIKIVATCYDLGVFFGDGFE